MQKEDPKVYGTTATATSSVSSPLKSKRSNRLYSFPNKQAAVASSPRQQQQQQLLLPPQNHRLEEEESESTRPIASDSRNISSSSHHGRRKKDGAFDSAPPVSSPRKHQQQVVAAATVQSTSPNQQNDRRLGFVHSNSTVSGSGITFNDNRPSSSSETTMSSWQNRDLRDFGSSHHSSNNTNSSAAAAAHPYNTNNGINNNNHHNSHHGNNRKQPPSTAYDASATYSPPPPAAGRRMGHVASDAAASKPPQPMWGKQSKKHSLEDDIPRNEELSFVATQPMPEAAPPPQPPLPSPFASIQQASHSAPIPQRSNLSSSSPMGLESHSISSGGAAAHYRNEIASASAMGSALGGGNASSSSSSASAHLRTESDPGARGRAGMHKQPSLNGGMSEEEALRAVMLRSMEQESQSSSAASLNLYLPKDVIDDARENAEMLRTFINGGDRDRELIKSFLDSCQSYQEKVQAAINQAMTHGDEEASLSLLDLNDFIDEAIKAGHKGLESITVNSTNHLHLKPLPAPPRVAAAKPQARPNGQTAQRPRAGDGRGGGGRGDRPTTPTDPAARHPSSNHRLRASPSLDLTPIIEKKDIFSLICILRAQQQSRRLAAAMALLQYARGAEEGDDESRRLCSEIRSSGGMHSLLTLFRTNSASHELKVVAALAVAYILPSYMESPAETPPALGLKIVECLRFLTTCGSVSPQGETITTQETFKAVAVGLASFWINHLERLLNSGPKDDMIAAASTRDTSVSLGRTRSAGRRVRHASTAHQVFDQRDEAIALQELVEMTVELIIQFVQSGETDGVGAAQDAALMWRYTLIEQVSAVEMARPIAVRQGILQILVSWIRSNEVEKIVPAASALRNLTSINDRYMAGWIHSQMVNKGAVQALAALASVDVGRDVRLAIAEILSSLCVAPHTRVAVVDADCVPSLIIFLYDHNVPSSEKVALHAAKALLQLAAGAITRANVLSADDMDTAGSPSGDKRDKLIRDIVDGGVIQPLVNIALSHRDELRTVAVEALRVLSEDNSAVRGTRLLLCENNAAQALGTTLRDGVSEGFPPENPFGNHDGARGDVVSSLPVKTLKELHETLCALANILDPIQEASNSPPTLSRTNTGNRRDPTPVLIKGCLETAQSGGLGALLRIASLPVSRSPTGRGVQFGPSMELLDEACRSLASMSPLLLSDAVASEGYSSYAHDVLLAFHCVLQQLFEFADKKDEDSLDLAVNALQGMADLARSDPLKVRLIDRSLPLLLQAKGVRDQDEISNAASLAFHSLDFAEDEIAVQVAGNNPNLLADWFCLQRSLLIQAMARAEIRQILEEVWEPAFMGIKRDDVTRLIRRSSERSRGDESAMGNDLFEIFPDDDHSAEQRRSVLQQYKDMYKGRRPREFPSIARPKSEGDSELDAGLLSRQSYPLNDCNTEMLWMLDHERSQSGAERNSLYLTDHVDRLLSCCFPSKLLRDQVLPIHMLRPDASFDFRAFMMPKRLYFQFRREGQLLSRLCDMEVEHLEGQDVHWTIAFTNSLFTGEFVDELVQVLYVSHVIQGLSFTRDRGWQAIRDSHTEDLKGVHGTAQLADLAGSLPPSITSLTFDGVFNEEDLRTFVTVLDRAVLETSSRLPISASRQRGKFDFLAIRNTPHLPSDIWVSFVDLLGKQRSLTMTSASSTKRALSSLKSLDLSGNRLGDEICASIIDLIYSKGSGCSIEQLDLSGNNIGKGTQFMNVLAQYVELHDVNGQGGGGGGGAGGAKGKPWKAKLRTLKLASNDLYINQVWLHLMPLLQSETMDIQSLDLSSNRLTLSLDDADDLARSLLANDSLCHLDLSNNTFGLKALDEMLAGLQGLDCTSCLAFLVLENNSPPLSPRQVESLSSFSCLARKNRLQRYFAERDEQSKDSPVLTARPSSGLKPIEESTPQSGSSIPTFSSSLENNNQITVLFSAPLVYRSSGGQLCPFAKLDFAMERELMWRCLKEASRDIELSFDCATHDRLLAAMTKRCSCLHYSGHGHQQFLPFEDGQGGPYWFNVDHFKSLIENEGEAPFQFVFVSACHSGLAGQTFASAGVPHVVCCQQDEELKDTAALAFTRQFYLALAVGHTVKASFDQGCKAVRATPNLRHAEEEMKKFVLLPEDGNHDVPIFDAKAIAEWPKSIQYASGGGGGGGPANRRESRMIRSRSVHHLGGSMTSALSVRNMIQDDPSPSPPQFFLGREIDLYNVLKALLEKRLVSVLGEPGIGRSSLVCALCHYVNERKSTSPIEHIYYVRVKQNRRRNKFLKAVKNLLAKVSERHPHKVGTLEADADVDDMSDMICRALKHEKALIVFDRVELLEETEEGTREFTYLLSKLYRETHGLKVILTNRRRLGIPALGEHHFQLEPLNFSNTVRLFSNLCPYLQQAADRRKLYRTLVSADTEDLLPTWEFIHEVTRKLFEKFGNGIPAEIEVAAQVMEKDDVINLMNGQLQKISWLGGHS